MAPRPTRNRRSGRETTRRRTRHMRRGAASVRPNRLFMGYFWRAIARARDMQGKGVCGAAQYPCRASGRPTDRGHHDLAHHVDAAGYDNMVAIGLLERSGKLCAPGRVDPVADAWWNAERAVLAMVSATFRENRFALASSVMKTLFNTPRTVPRV